MGALKGLDALKTIIEAQSALASGEASQAIQMLSDRLTQYDSALQPLALYWLGRARLAQSDDTVQSEGILDLLRIPAIFGEQDPELAAAGLFESMQALSRQGQVRQSIAVRRELLDRYGQTWHAAKVRAGDRETEKQP